MLCDTVDVYLAIAELAHQGKPRPVCTRHIQSQHLQQWVYHLELTFASQGLHVRKMSVNMQSRRVRYNHSDSETFSESFNS